METAMQSGETPQSIEQFHPTKRPIAPTNCPEPTNTMPPSSSGDSGPMKTASKDCRSKRETHTTKSQRPSIRKKSSAPQPQHQQQIQQTIVQCDPAVEDKRVTKGLTLRILTWNVDGFKDPTRRLAIESVLWKNKVDIAVLTESHLLDEDIFTTSSEGKERIMKLKLEHYKVIHWHNRESSVTQRCGGELILARPGVNVTLIHRIFSRGAPSAAVP